MCDRQTQRRPSAVNLDPFVDVDLNLWPTVYNGRHRADTDVKWIQELFGWRKRKHYVNTTMSFCDGMPGWGNQVQEANDNGRQNYTHDYYCTFIRNKLKYKLFKAGMHGHRNQLV